MCSSVQVCALDTPRCSPAASLATPPTTVRSSPRWTAHHLRPLLEGECVNPERAGMEPMPTNHHLLELAEEEGPWVTITMPLEGGGPLAKGDPIRYRNLLRSLDEPFEARVIDPELRARMMEPLRALADRHDVFNAGARGLVVFANAKRVEHWHLPVPLEEDARVDERPYLEPLIPLVTDPTHFYVVALSMQQLRLLECNRFVYRELPLPPGTPT